MSMPLPKFKDDVVRNTLGKFPTAPFGWYMMAGFAFYCKQRPILSDECFDDLEKYIINNWEGIKHPQKSLFKFEDIKAGSGFVDFSQISYLLKTSTQGHIATVYANIKPEQSVPQPVTPKKSVVEPSDTAKLYFSGVVQIDRSLVDDAKTKELTALADLAKQHMHTYYGGSSMYITNTKRAVVVSKMLALIRDLKATGIKVVGYSMNETLIDGHYKDVWNVLEK